MSHEELTAALEVVHRELADAEHLDPEDVEILRTTMAEIQSALDEQRQEATLADQMAASARRFEASHPVLTENLGRIADLLQRMGI